jgi:hypothetical protein
VDLSKFYGVIAAVDSVKDLQTGQEPHREVQGIIAAMVAV